MSPAAVWRVAQQLGGSSGTAVLAVIIASAATHAGNHSGIADAFNEAFCWATGFTALAVALSLLLPSATRAP